jgi:putative DNA primase/helicase
MLFSNELPKLQDSSQALPGRMIVLQLTRSWLGEEDITLGDRLTGELPGIMLWAIKGWQRLQDRGYLIQPDSATGLIRDLEDLSSSIGAFIRERCELGVGRRIERGVLYQAWKIWCQERSIQDEDEATFGRDLRAAVPDLGDVQPRAADGSRPRMYVGIGLK